MMLSRMVVYSQELKALAMTVLGHVAFRYTNSVGARDQFSIAAQWLACAPPCRRFADILADAR